ncbi:MAG TPA: hypothetical protein VI078_13165 [bacterium]
MRSAGTAAGRRDWLDRATAVLLLLAVVAALAAAGRLAAAGADGGELLAAMRERTDRRLVAEREQLRSALAGGAPGAGALAAAQAAAARLADNSQIHLYLAEAHRERGEAEAALREYRRAVELVRDYADRRSRHYVGAELGPWLRGIRAKVPWPALGDLYYLERALAGGCA